MGVPAFFRWLSVRYPKVVMDALTEDELEYMYSDFKKQGGDPNEIDLLEGDLDGEIQKKIKDNNLEHDNLYLDMNGIIHPCAHPQDKPQPTCENGVAPRAKMNQQRSRRFRGALDTEEREIREEEIKSKWAREGIKFSEREPDSEKFDQNVITPGTEFMWRLSKALQYYVLERIQTDDLWRNIKVVFSDASIPGEGEHKILDFIRSQRLAPGYDPNTRHCIYGADADLIMLGLSTHEPHFSILREAFQMDSDKKCSHCGQQGHLNSECKTNPDNQTAKVQLSKTVKFQFVKLNVVREYLFLEFKDLQLPFTFDFERIVDDFVFLCFFVGNDFLPHLPSLHIREGALDAILVIYKNLLPSLGDYLTKNGEIEFSKVDIVFNDIAKIEEESFRVKKQNEERYTQRQAQNAANGSNGRGGRGGYQQRGGYQNRGNQQQRPNNHIKFDDPKPDQAVELKPSSAVKEDEAKPQAVAEEQKDETIEQFESRQIQEIGKLQQQLSEDELNKLASEKMKEIVKKLLNEKSKIMADSYVDRVQFGTEGWKLRYYQEKFHIDETDFQEFTQKIKQAYIEGLQWVYSYYYKGCISWYWFYPYHYAPFASDLVNCDRVVIKFEMGEPASPFEQLMAVMPKQSAHCLPQCYRHLLSSPDSEIIDFYPINFKLDINGARYAWMGVNLLPFIDRQRLIRAMRKADGSGQKLLPIEAERNRKGQVMLFFHKEDKSESALQQTLLKHVGSNLELFSCYERKDQIAGTIRIIKVAAQIGQNLAKPLNKYDVQDIKDNQVYQIAYESSEYKMHLTKLLEGVKHQQKEVEDFEIYHVNRRFFNGENAVRMLERILGIDASVSAIYRPQGYVNNHSTYGQAREVRPGQSVEEYQQNMLGKRGQRDYQNEDGGHHQNKRYESNYGGNNNYNSSSRSNNSHYSNSNNNSSGGYQGRHNSNYGYQQSQNYQHGNQGSYNQYNPQHQQQTYTQQPEQQLNNYNHINYNIHHRNQSSSRGYGNEQLSSYQSNQSQSYSQQYQGHSRHQQQSSGHYYYNSNGGHQNDGQTSNQYYNQQSQQQQNYASDQNVLLQPQAQQQPTQQPNQLLNLLTQLQQTQQRGQNSNMSQYQQQQQQNNNNGGRSQNRFSGFQD
ncbi:5-3 exoribonuclease 2 [Stylonychia lemnae]|uniref:5'-3' exoribonuclease n=1 Tax=Stylonychia lemnae TaxID=5949 RepID=A0A078A6J2_STYLE|nr:5-3 exoribonuclease 2 [Stylonychia lemnae]|eukprot:CDW77829.1 5-3 exoribonuclease 2 [Stylonychia lemnae]